MQPRWMWVMVLVAVCGLLACGVEVNTPLSGNQANQVPAAVAPLLQPQPTIDTRIPTLPPATDTPEAALQSWLLALAQGDRDAATQLACSRVRQSSDFQDLLNLLAPAGQAKHQGRVLSFTVNRTSQSTDRVVVQFSSRITGWNDTIKSNAVSIVKEGGKWKYCG